MEWGEYPTGEYIEAKGCYAVTIMGRRYKIHSYGDTVFSRQGWTAWHGADHVLSDIAHTMTPQGGVPVKPIPFIDWGSLCLWTSLCMASIYRLSKVWKMLKHLCGLSGHHGEDYAMHSFRVRVP